MKTIEDGASFNDPQAWGFCRWCAFLVASDGRTLIDHPFDRSGAADWGCNGSGAARPEETPYTAWQQTRVDLRKDAHRSRSRAYWQRLRSNRREKDEATQKDEATPAFIVTAGFVTAIVTAGFVTAREDRGEHVEE